ncbi:hypothetical protein E4U55_002104 [Claviceps digitariae]|nr:hypothetical protein E4U55_002104 [Claviceps digitariae]
MPSIPGEHTGILREENIALRQIFGYRLATSGSPYSVPAIGQYLPGTLIKDILIISIDVDTGGGYEVIKPGQNFHIGISIFDTRCLINPLDDYRNAITSYQFINNPDAKPCKWAAYSFLFGNTESISLPDLPAKFSLLTQGRDYILVAHGAREDVKFMNNLDPGIAGRACYILDTVKAAQYPLQLYYRYSLEKLLQEFIIPYANLHAAGNDAHFVLRVLLMITIRDGQMVPETVTTSHGELFHTLDAIAHAPVALPVWVEKPPVEKKEKKVKLGVKAKGRLKRARKLARRMLRELPYAGELDGQGSGDETEEPTAALP